MWEEEGVDILLKPSPKSGRLHLCPKWKPLLLERLYERLVEDEISNVGFKFITISPTIPSQHSAAISTQGNLPIYQPTLLLHFHRGEGEGGGDNQSQEVHLSPAKQVKLISRQDKNGIRPIPISILKLRIWSASKTIYGMDESSSSNHTGEGEIISREQFRCGLLELDTAGWESY